MAILQQLKHAWNAFTKQEKVVSYSSGMTFSQRPDRVRPRLGNERTIISSIYTRLALDVAGIDIRHVRLDDQDRYLEDMKSGLNECLTLEANIDQAAQHFRQDIASKLFEKGHAAIVPIDTTISPETSGGYDILTMRVGHVISWMPDDVLVRVYNKDKGHYEDVPISKRACAIVENPLYDVMNEPNSTLQRLIRKLGQLDAIDEQSSSGKLDIIIQLPYVVKSQSRRDQADKRRTDLEHQMSGSKYGIAYIDGTEKVTQLNRPAENNMLKQIEFLVDMLYGQLGLTPEIMNGTADEKAMLNYRNRTIQPIANSIVEAMRRTFLTKTARSQKQSIKYFFDPFKLVPLNDIAEIADKLTRNEVVSANELRGFMGIKPSRDPKADELHNSNMPDPTPAPSEPIPKQPTELGGSSQNGSRQR